jgi:hypothetical protein
VNEIRNKESEKRKKVKYKKEKVLGRGDKVKLSLCLTEHHIMKAYWGRGGIAPRILNLVTRWRW